MAPSWAQCRGAGQEWLEGYNAWCQAEATTTRSGGKPRATSCLPATCPRGSRLTLLLHSCVSPTVTFHTPTEQLGAPLSPSPASFSEQAQPQCPALARGPQYPAWLLVSRSQTPLKWGLLWGTPTRHLRPKSFHDQGRALQSEPLQPPPSGLRGRHAPALPTCRRH